RTVAGRQRRAYLGRSADLTAERLRAAAIQLAGDPADTPASRGTSASSAAARPRSAAPLLTTKLYLPRPRGALVPRPRLLARLNAGLGLPLTLVAAPAGFGKTTLLADWLDHQRLEARDLRLVEESPSQASSLKPLAPHIAWLSLDAADNDPNIFFRYLIRALRLALPSARALSP